MAFNQSLNITVIQNKHTKLKMEHKILILSLVKSMYSVVKEHAERVGTILYRILYRYLYLHKICKLYFLRSLNSLALRNAKYQNPLGNFVIEEVEVTGDFTETYGSLRLEFSEYLLTCTSRRIAVEPVQLPTCNNFNFISCILFVIHRDCKNTDELIIYRNQLPTEPLG